MDTIEKLQHREAPKGHIHIIHNLEFMTMSERDTYNPKIEDLDKICLVRSPYCFYVLKSISPLEWKEIGGVSKEDLDKKQENLESGVNIKKINGNDILGEGNIEIKALDEIYKSANNPTIDTNPKNTGELWVNFVTPEIFICQDNTIDKNKWKGIFTREEIRPIRDFELDIFKDNSCSALIDIIGTVERIKGNATVTKNNVSYQNAQVEQSIKSKSTDSMLEIKGNIKTISMFAKFPLSAIRGYYIFDNRYLGGDSYCYSVAEMTSLEGNGTVQFFINGVNTKNIPKNEWCHITLVFTKECNGIRFFNYGDKNIYGVSEIEIEHIRLFNRVITNQEITALRNEIL